MLDEKDIQRLMEVFPTREEVAAKEDIKGLREDFNELLNAIDAYAKKADTYFQEMVMLSHKVDRHERWILQLAEKLGVTLKA
ncbi:MAG: hypothetical protein HYS38_00855 [Acidobacteria bacterium]|nr:hypothetical protein [Acidobacteriota bacterium]